VLLVSGIYDWRFDCHHKAVAAVQDTAEAKTFKRGLMLKIQRAANGEVVFTLSGRMDAENITGLRTLFGSEAKGRRIVLDLKDLTLVDRDAVGFLQRCEENGIKLKNCPAYIREWIRQRTRQFGRLKLNAVSQRTPSHDSERDVLATGPLAAEAAG
jgi:hypothetical protein